LVSHIPFKSFRGYIIFSSLITLIGSSLVAYFTKEGYYHFTFLFAIYLSFLLFGVILRFRMTLKIFHVPFLEKPEYQLHEKDECLGSIAIYADKYFILAIAIYYFLLFIGI